MKWRVLTAVLAVLFIASFQAHAAVVWISSVDVIPDQPLETDIITFNISGWAATNSSGVEYDLFSQDGTSLQLDLYVNMGYEAADTIWGYSKDISPLPADTYTLQVRAFDSYYGTLEDTSIVDFTVVPEPATFLFVALGGLLLRRKR